MLPTPTFILEVLTTCLLKYTYSYLDAFVYLYIYCDIIHVCYVTEAWDAPSAQKLGRVI